MTPHQPLSLEPVSVNLWLCLFAISFQQQFNLRRGHDARTAMVYVVDEASTAGQLKRSEFEPGNLRHLLQGPGQFRRLLAAWTDLVIARHVRYYL